MGNLIFIEEGHKYFVDDIPIPSVTEIIADLWPVNKEYITPGSDVIGRMVHSVSAGIDLGMLEEFPEEIEEYQEAYDKFRKEFPHAFVGIEQMYYNPELWYAGTIDRDYSSSGIIDIKTGSPIRWHRLQLAAYACFFPDPKTVNRCSVHIMPDGKYKRKEYEDPNDIDMWLNWMTCYDWKHPRRPRGGNNG